MLKHCEYYLRYLVCPEFFDHGEGVRMQSLEQMALGKCLQARLGLWVVEETYCKEDSHVVECTGNDEDRMVLVKVGVALKLVGDIQVGNKDTLHRYKDSTSSACVLADCFGQDSLLVYFDP